MSPWLWLIGAAAAGAGAYLTGWPAWNAARKRGIRDLNAERYLAWRGRAGPRLAGTSLTKGERQRLAVAALLGLVAAFCLVGFFTYV